MIIPLEDWSDNGIKIRDGKVYVDPANDTDADERVVFDLHIGEVSYNPGPVLGRRIRDGKPLKIAPQQALRIQTREELFVGPGVFGQICSKASLTSLGLVVSNIKVDPRFHGFLEITVYNIAATPVVIARDKPFSSVFFQHLDKEVGGQARSAPPPPARDVSGPVDFLSRNRQTIVTILISVGGSLLATWAFH